MRLTWKNWTCPRHRPLPTWISSCSATRLRGQPCTELLSGPSPCVSFGDVSGQSRGSATDSNSSCGGGILIMSSGNIIGAVGARAGTVEQGIAVAEAALAALVVLERTRLRRDMWLLAKPR